MVGENLADYSHAGATEKGNLVTGRLFLCFCPVVWGRYGVADEVGRLLYRKSRIFEGA